VAQVRPHSIAQQDVEFGVNARSRIKDPAAFDQE
jgi:hypothetical protein